MPPESINVPSHGLVDGGGGQAPVSEFQAKVYTLCSQVPKGKSFNNSFIGDAKLIVGRFTTYKVISNILNSSPRAVGQALKRNPFAPRVPCHRVISSDYSLGGFYGQSHPQSQKIQQKRQMLMAEGLHIDATGILNAQDRVLVMMEDHFNSR